MSTNDRLNEPIPAVLGITASLGTVYALVLSQVERQLPINPDFTAVSVVGGVLISLAPVMWLARRQRPRNWRVYERMVAAGFVGTGLPIILWQLIELILRRI